MCGVTVGWYTNLMIKLVIFDWDDCIVGGSSAAYYACYGDAIAKAGIVKTGGEVRTGVTQLWGRPHRDVIANIIGADDPLLDKVVSNYEQCIFTHTFSSHISLIPGAKQKLELLRERHKLALATGMNGKLLREHILPHFGMQNFFDAIRSSSELPDSSRGKPYPDMLFSILEELQVATEDVVMVGDAMGDVLMAQAAGVCPIVVLTGQLTRGAAEALHVKTIIQSIAQLEV